MDILFPVPSRKLKSVLTPGQLIKLQAIVILLRVKRLINMIMTALVREAAKVLIQGAIALQELAAERQTGLEQELEVEPIREPEWYRYRNR